MCCRLPDPPERELTAALDEARAEAEDPAATPQSVAPRVGRLAGLLRGAGAMASGGEAVAGPLLRIAALLGPAADVVRRAVAL